MLDYSPFCPVCSELVVRRIFRFADPIDEVIADGRDLVLEAPRDDLAVSWFVDDELAGEGTSGEPVRLRGVGDGRHALRIEVREETPLVRVDEGDLGETLHYVLRR